MKIDDQLKLLRKELMHYFSDLVSCTMYIHAFWIDPARLPLATGEQEEII